MVTKCGEQYCNPYCKKHLCVEMSAIRIAHSLGIKIINTDGLSIDPKDVEL